MNQNSQRVYFLGGTYIDKGQNKAGWIHKGKDGLWECPLRGVSGRQPGSHMEACSLAHSDMRGEQDVNTDTTTKGAEQAHLRAWPELNKVQALRLFRTLACFPRPANTL